MPVNQSRVDFRTGVRAMMLTIATSHRPATDLGFLLHKNPDRHHVAELSFGTAHVLFPVAAADRCKAAVLLEIDPVGLVRGGHRQVGQANLAHYVNDRPYAASSYLSVALAKLFGTAMSGRSKERPELAGAAIPLEIGLPVVPCNGGAPLLRRLFEPLGYQVAATPVALDPQFPEWGDSRYLAVTLAGTLILRAALEHLFVLLPVLDDDKHYWVGTDEVDKLLRRGGQWLAGHPDKDLIARRYLRHDRQLTRAALARLVADEAADPDRADAENDAAEEAAERKVGLHEQRIERVVAVITQAARAGGRSRLRVGEADGCAAQAGQRAAGYWPGRVTSCASGRCGPAGSGPDVAEGARQGGLAARFADLQRRQAARL